MVYLFTSITLGVFEMVIEITPHVFLLTMTLSIADFGLF